MFIESDLGLNSPNLLADDDEFVHVTPKVDEIGPKSKREYLAAGRFFDLRSTFPDLDYQAHDFRLVDQVEEGTERQSNTTSVRVTLRMTGTMTNELRLRKKTLPPTNETMTCPPEVISMTFDKRTGKMCKLCSGFVMDRLVGNTDGLCGVQAAATIAGEQPSDWEVYSPSLVLSRIFGRPVKRLEEPKSLDAPFPEGVLISLAKGVIAADNGAKDPSVLAPSFSFCSPLFGPIDKRQFLDVLSGFDLKEAFPDLQTKFTNFRVDQYDPYRVWVDGLGSGTWTGPLMGKGGNGFRYEGSPESISLTFNDEGLCTRLTAGVAMDPTEGNTGGLGGVFGIYYATNSILPGFSSRPLPHILGRVAKMSSIDNNEEPKSQVDDTALNDTFTVQAKPEAVAEKATIAPKVTVPEFNLPKIELFKISPLKIVSPKPSQRKEAGSTKSETTEEKSSEESLARLKEEAEAKKSKAKERIRQFEIDAKEKRMQEEAERRAATIEMKRRAEDARNKVLEERQRQAEERRRATEAMGAKQRRVLEERKLAAEARKKEAAEAAEQKKRDAAAKRSANRPKEVPAAAKRSTTISLSGLFPFLAASPAPTGSDAPARGASQPKPSKSFITAPPGVPTLSKFRQNRDGSITAYIFNSPNFKDGEMITTSPIKTNASPGTVVQTSSGSKYFLDPGKTKVLKEYQGRAKKDQQGKSKRSASLPLFGGAAIREKTPTVQKPSTAKSPAPKPRATFSLFGMSGGRTPTKTQLTRKPARRMNKPSTATPSGIPMVMNWKQNFDGSISGVVTGSDDFAEGERIITSPIRKGEVVQSKSTVTTINGTKYFLV